MKIEKIQSYINPKTTGYVAASGVALTVMSGISKNKTLRKTHKPLALATVILTVLHALLIEFYNYKYRHK